MKKRMLTLSLIFGVATLLLAGVSIAASPIVMKLAETHPQDYPTTKGDYEFARLVKERTNGRIVIEVFHSKQLGEERAVIEQV
ncbi:TRAP transporter substrate-binding protein, partial [Patescibacteria group bacterium]|nr:TRAP transporter substrate-binding protein [Patescibacteria group bacterium]